MEETRIRLDRYLANNGVGSRKEVKELIRDGHVKVNGVVETSAKRVIMVSDAVSVRDSVLAYMRYVYYMLNKPAGVLSATNDRRETVVDLIEEADRRQGLFPVGRLDIDTTGLLLITNDGRMGHELLAPRKKVSKRYIAEVDQPLTAADIERFRSGFFLEPERIQTMPAKLCILDEYRAAVEIFEGKYHQVKRMFAACGKTVTALRRESMGPLVLDPLLEPGEYRPLSEEELNELRQVIGRGNA